MSKAVVASVALVAVACSSGSQSPVAPTPQASDAPSEPGTARYRVTFQSSWSAASHPVDFPSNAHFSPLVGGTHNGSVRFWNDGALASTGIKDMAERGRTSPLDQEIQAAVSSGTAQHVLLGGAIDLSPGSVSLEFDVSQSHPLVTLVSMVAPSPDWFVGVSGLPLFENGRWIDERRVELVPWDAGTDSGATFTSPDVVTAPPQNISRILSAPLSPAGAVVPLGTFTFARIQP